MLVQRGSQCASEARAAQWCPLLALGMPLATGSCSSARRRIRDGTVNVGTEIGDRVGQDDSRQPVDDRIRPLRLPPDSALPEPVRALYDVLDLAVERGAWVADGNVQLVLRQEEPGAPRYVNLLNWNYREMLETVVFVRGAYRDITDLSSKAASRYPAQSTMASRPFRSSWDRARG